MLSVKAFQISASFFVEILPVFHHTLQYSSKWKCVCVCVFMQVLVHMRPCLCLCLSICIYV